MKYKIWREEISKGIEKKKKKNNEKFQNEGFFFDGLRRLEKTQNSSCER